MLERVLTALVRLQQSRIAIYTQSHFETLSICDVVFVGTLKTTSIWVRINGAHFLP